MNKVILLLSCLICCAAAGRLGLERRLWWLNNLRGGSNVPIYHTQGVATTNQRQQFLLDVLLQVQKPLVNSELIEMGKVLITDPAMYKQPIDEILLEFLEQARNQEILGRNDVYNPVDMRQVRQLIGLQRFFALARDWDTFQRNVCFARLHINPVMFVNALSLAVRDRSDTQDLVLPPMNEILPQLYYDNDLLISAQNTDLDRLTNQTPYVRPGLLDMLTMHRLGPLIHVPIVQDQRMGLWNPWREWRLQMARGAVPAIWSGPGSGIISGGRHVDSRRRQDRQDNTDYEPEARIVLPVKEQGKQITNDIGLNIVWNNIVNEVLMQAAEMDIQRVQQIGGIRSEINDQIQREQTGRKSGLKWEREPLENTWYAVGRDAAGVEQIDMDIRGNIRQNIEPQVWYNNGFRNVRLNKIGGQNELPEVDVNSDRLLHTNRRQHQYPNQNAWNKKNSWQTWQRSQVPDWSQQKSSADEWSRIGGQGGNRMDIGNIHSSSIWENDWNKAILSEKVHKTTCPTQQLTKILRGEILLQSLKELVARMKMDEIVQSIENNGEQWQRQSMEMQQQRYQTEQLIDDIAQQLYTVFEQVCQEQRIPRGSEQTLNVVVDILSGAVPVQQLSSSVQRKLQQLQQQVRRVVSSIHGTVDEVTPLSLLVGDLRDPIIQQIIISLNQQLDVYRQQLQSYTRQELLASGITIQDARIDPLVTYFDVVDSDLVNTLDQQLLQSGGNNLHKMAQKVVARQVHLNHQPFTISLNIESQRNQAVVVRILLGPKVDVNGRRVPLKENQQNFITLDAFVEHLGAGENQIERHSTEASGTSQGVSTISQIYNDIMTGRTKKTVWSSNCQLPQRLLLPRGAIGGAGLPVQLLVVVTPLTHEDLWQQQHDINPEYICGLGIAGINLDQLPLGFPLDRPLTGIESLDVPNIMVMETAIRHDERVRN